jgi:DnaA-homolog protein
MSAQLPLNVRLKDSSSFENFYVGRNREAVSSVQAVASALARGAAAPEQVVFIWGPAGCGRTHLLHAACRVAHAAGKAASYFSLAEAAALPPELLEGAECANLVCLDDAEAVAGRDDWERALFALFERLRAEGGALLVAATGAPAQLGLQLPDLVTRFGWGPVFRLEALDDVEKLATVQLRARNRGLDLTGDVARYILARYPRDMDSLFGLLDRLDRQSLASQRRITIPFLRSIEEENSGRG